MLRGWGTMRVGDQEFELTPDVLVRVGPAETRKIAAGAEGLRLLALGGYPGAPFRVKPQSELSG